MKNNKAFTLAELLVTLTIIAVIAGMTIPGLKKTANERTYIASLLKAQSELTQATKALKQTIGPIATWSISQDEIMNNYRTVLQESTVVSQYFVSSMGKAEPYSISGNEKTLYTTDGITYTPISTAGCKNHSSNATCFKMIVDVNGPQKPNIIGIDVYAFDVKKNGDVIPVSGKCPPSAESDFGFGCTAKAVMEKKISW